ncbi:MAG: ChbG/HpnK family deacetylase [Blastocatellia bacterium]|nr:ChbG/HpnK family deacetylase [Blastocatellia bacterium]
MNGSSFIIHHFLFMRRLIVNADDFGIASGVNRAIIEAHARGIVTSATVMVNMPAFAEAAELARSHPSLGVGLHFNLTQGRPIAEPARVAGLLDEQGEFPGTSTAVARRLLLGRATREEVAIELRAQIERAQAHGVRLTHIDSHKHAHALPAVFAVILETIGRYGIDAVRLHRERGSFSLFPLKLAKQRLVALALTQLGRIDAARLSRAGVNAPDALVGIARTGCWTVAWLKEAIAGLPDGTSELMCHPGEPDAEPFAVRTRLRESRAIELALLTDPEIASHIANCGVALVNYAALARP